MKRIAPLLLVALLPSSPLPAQQDAAPAAMARVVSERKDDVAWENDLTAYRIYGPPLKNSPEHENSGIDVWFKCVTYPVMNKWYRDEIEGRRSYHKDHGEGYDGYKVGDTRGGGGTALWVDGKLVIAGVYRSAKILSPGPEEAKFVVHYRYDTPQGPVDEEKTITQKPGDRFFTSRSVFTRDGKPVAGLPVAAGLVTQSNKAEIEFRPAQGIVAMWDRVNGHGFGTGIVAPKDSVVEMLRQPTDRGSEHALCVMKTDDKGAVEFRVASAWEKGSKFRSAADWSAFLEKAP